MSSRKRKILTLEFSVGVTDVHSVPVPIENQDLRTNPCTIRAPSMWVWMGVAAARDTSDERPPLFYDHF